MIRLEVLYLVINDKLYVFIILIKGYASLNYIFNGLYILGFVRIHRATILIDGMSECIVPRINKMLIKPCFSGVPVKTSDWTECRKKYTLIFPKIWN